MRVVSALMFFPRGGSAHVARALARQLPATGWDVTIVSGSRRGADATAFYSGLDTVAVDFDTGQAPMQPSYEDRPDAPDHVFAKVGEDEFERHVDAWSDALQRARADEADALHLHHLTPIYDAAARVAPDVPIVGHLHGTELLMLEHIADGAPASWEHAQAWWERMRAWAARCERLVVLSPSQIERVERLLDVDAQRCVVIPNGYDPERFKHCDVDEPRFWRHELAEAARGWLPGQEPGSLRYPPDVAESLAERCVLLCVGRFTEVKRMGLLVRAYARARERFARPAALVFVGGHDGEWEAEHPGVVAQELGLDDVFLAGWHDHEELPSYYCAADATVLASVREQFGLVLVEGMACERPAIAVGRYGPADIVTPGETGWLVEPDDEASLADALVEAVSEPAELVRRGEAAARDVAQRFAWPAVAERFAETLTQAAASDPRAANQPA
jgi:glycosyltransferase involved in cell wall biosynthesis